MATENEPTTAAMVESPMLNVGVTSPAPPQPTPDASDSSKSALPGEDPSLNSAPVPPLPSPSLPRPMEGDNGHDLAREIAKEASSRRSAGWAMGIVGLVVVVVVLMWAVCNVNAVIQEKDVSAYLMIIAMSAHAVISIAAVWFGYQMLRAAERMFVPQRLMNDSKDVEVLRALIGITAPTTAAADQLKALTTITGDFPSLIKALGEAAASIKDKKT